MKKTKFLPTRFFLFSQKIFDMLCWIFFIFACFTLDAAQLLCLACLSADLLHWRFREICSSLASAAVAASTLIRQRIT
jgi:hypothetical protein